MIVAAAVIAIMMVFAVYGLLRNDIVIPIPGRRSGGSFMPTQYFHFHGTPAWIVFLALLAVAAGVVVGMHKWVHRIPGARRDDRLEGGLLFAGLLLLIGMLVAKYVGYV